jgi:hypothetical protein
MSKAHRGKGILDKPARARGTCPVTSKSGVKLLYQVDIEGKQVMVSKVGKATLANAKVKAKKAAPAAPKEEKAAEARENAASVT